MAHVVPFIAAGIVLFLVQPLALPVSLASLAHAWVIPELYAQRGANVVRREGQPRAGRRRGALGRAARRPRRPRGARAARADGARASSAGASGAWLVGPAGALLVRPGGQRVVCYCVGVNDPALPSGDRIAHLLLALRADEEGFATVANLAFSGARWRVRRRLAPAMRPALDAGVAAARRLDTRAMP